MLDAILPIDVDPLTPPTDGNTAPMGVGSSVLESYFLTAMYRSLGAALVEESQVGREGGGHPVIITRYYMLLFPSGQIRQLCQKAQWIVGGVWGGGVGWPRGNPRPPAHIVRIFL